MQAPAAVALAQRELVGLARASPDVPTFAAIADHIVSRVLPHDGSCWHTMDPATLLITGHTTLNLPNRFPLLAANEYLADDVNRFADLARAPHPVGVLTRATGGQPERSVRWREMLSPNGFDAELRVSFVDGRSCPGSLILVRDKGRPDFTEGEIEAARLLSGVFAGAVRRIQLRTTASRDDLDAPGVLVLDRLGDIDSASGSALNWLECFDGQPPPAVFSVAATARDGRAAQARVRSPDGRWWIMHGSQLEGDRQGRTSVIVEGARPDDLVPLIVDAYELSRREQTVVGMVLRGASTRQISRALAISPYTVQEHLTSIFNKTAVRSRAELVGQVFFRHVLPGIE